MALKDLSVASGRLSIDHISPVISHGKYPAKAVLGEIFPISATLWREGHDALSATLVLKAPSSEEGTGEISHITMISGGDPDKRYASFIPDIPGRWKFHIEAWSDPCATWYHTIEKKTAAGQDSQQLSNDLLVGAQLLEKLLKKNSGDDRRILRRAIQELRDDSLSLDQRLSTACGEEIAAILENDPLRALVTRSKSYEIQVDIHESAYASWYEFFPRSTGGVDDQGNPVHGTFRTAAEELARISDMGFDVVYLPPIHPIGEINRKGKNNTLTPTSTDVGSPWAIGSAEGGHEAIHPRLGTVEDFQYFVDRASELGLSVALDLALQCAPDHPWAQQHPEWFTVLPDGSIAYAENPPKKYQDIYPLNFDNDPEGLYHAILEVVELWISRGVRIFRVDNPHTKPAQFWEWLISKVHEKDPDIVFLAEAFTRPPRLYGLAKVGFTQSYSYFTWKTTKKELEGFAQDCADYSDIARPNLFVNTPDILHESLQLGGRAMFAQRATLAATISPLWGVYSGYELYENVPVHVGSEEYMNSEKYELRPRDFQTALESGDSLAPYITFLNQVRRDHPALQQQRNLHIHASDNDSLIAYSRVDPVSGDALLIVVNLDPRHAQEGRIRVDLDAIGLAPRDGFPDNEPTVENYPVQDLITGHTFEWGRDNYVRLDPYKDVAHILVLPTVSPSRRHNLVWKEEEFNPYN